MSVGATIALGAVLGLALGIIVSVTTEVPIAPEAGLVFGGVVGWLSRRDRARIARKPVVSVPSHGRVRRAGMASGTGAEATAAGRPGGRENRSPFTWQDVRGGTRRRADELTCTETEAAALKALRTATGEIDGDMERHTVRQYLIAERLADTRGIAYDRELLLCASFLHDAGLYGPASSGDVYIKDSGRYARRTLEPLGWSEERLRACVDACEQHHAFTARWWMPNEVELVRRSDLVEVLPELVRFGIPRSWLKRELWHAVPRTGFWPATLDVLRAHWRRMLPGMFRPPGPGETSAAG